MNEALRTLPEASDFRHGTLKNDRMIEFSMLRSPIYLFLVTDTFEKYAREGLQLFEYVIGDREPRDSHDS